MLHCTLKRSNNYDYDIPEITTLHNWYNVFASLFSFLSTESGISGKSGHGIVSKLSSTGNSQTFLLSNFPSGPLNDSRPEKVLLINS